MSELDPCELDLRGMKCPLPALLAGRQLDRLRPGARLIVLSDDPMAAIDIPHRCRERGDRVVAMTRDGTTLRFDIERAARAD